MPTYNETIFFLQHYSALFLFLVISYITGGAFLKQYIVQENGNRVFLFTSFGMGILILINFFTALFYQFNRLTVGIALLSIPAYSMIKGDLRAVCSDQGNDVWNFCKQHWAWIILIAGLTAPVLLVPLYPPVTWDEIAAHLPWAKDYVEHSGLSYNIFLRYPLYPQNIDLLYALSLLYYDDILAHLMHAVTAIITALGIYHLGTITFDKKTGIIAVLIFLSNPIIVLHLMKTSYIDLGLMLFVFLAFYCITMWTMYKQDYWIYLAAISTGIAMGTKQLGMMYVVFYAVWIAFQCRKTSTTAKYLLISLVVGSPWYIRSYFISGDPFHPFGGEIFGYWLWDKVDLVGQTQHLLQSTGTTRGLPSLLKLPWNIIFNSEYHTEGSIASGMIAAFAAIFLFPKLNKFSRILTLFVFVNVLIWFFTSQILRYLVPVFPMIALLAACVLIQVYETYIIQPTRWIFRDTLTWRNSAVKGLAVVALFVVVWPNLNLGKKIMIELDQNPIPVTATMRDKYINDRVPSFELLQIANQNPHLAIYQYGFENSFYFAKGTMMGDFFGLARYSKIENSLSEPKALHDTLTSLKANLFLVNKHAHELELPNFDYGPSFEPYFFLIAETPEAALYRIK
jgi:hypothetical protein